MLIYFYINIITINIIKIKCPSRFSTNPWALILNRSISMNIYPQVNPYVYRLDHPVTGEFYIGYRAGNKASADQDLGYKYFTSSKYVKPRFSEFKVTIIAECFDADFAYDLEQELIHEDWQNPLILNKMCHYGKLRYKMYGSHSEETRAKLCAARRKQIRKPHSEETKYKMRAAKVGMLGHQQSEETRAKISASKTGISRSDETKAKISAARKGKKYGPMTEETKAKISAANKGKTISEETRAKLRVLVKGTTRKPHSEETKAKMSMANKKYRARKEKENNDQNNISSDALGSGDQPITLVIPVSGDKNVFSHCFS